jgi:hypothetical protein
MEPKISKIAKGISAVLIALGAIFTILLISKGDEAVVENPDSTNTLLAISYIAFFAGIAVTVFNAVSGLIKNPSSLKKSLMGVGFLAVIFLISFLISSGADFEQYQAFEVTEATSKWVSTGLNMFYITGVVAIVSVLWSSFGRIAK